MGSSLIPEGAAEVGIPTSFKRGEIMDCIVASCHGERGDQVSAGLILGDLVQKSNGIKRGGLVCEWGEKTTEGELRVKLQDALDELYSRAYSEQYDLVNVRMHTEAFRVEKNYGTALVGLCFTEQRYDFRPTHTSYPPFLDHTATYEKSKYAIQPVVYDRTATWKKGTAEAPSAILEASKHVEDYDIETDSQAYKCGIHTAAPVFNSDAPDSMIQAIRPIALRLFKDRKIPCFLGGDHSISIGVLEALKEVIPHTTILQLDAHTDLRPSYDGSPYNHACVMHQAKKLFENVVHCGIRSMSHRERNAFDPEKTFFAADIHANPLWVDDVLSEVGENVYVTLDASVFDPSIMSTGTPEPNGLSYAQVLKLLKALAKERNVVGFDVVELRPIPGNHAPDYLIAKLIYQWISFSEK